MNKDEFAQMKVRQTLVDKIPQVDIDMLPALEDYINDGDRSMFEQYNTFRKSFDMKRKIEETELEIEASQKRLESLKEKLNECEHLEADYRKQINSVIIGYQNWVVEMRDATEKEHPQKETPTMKDLLDFAQACIDASPNGKQRKLWLKEGDKMRTVTAILFDGKKAIIEADDPETILVPLPNWSKYGKMPMPSQEYGEGF